MKYWKKMKENAFEYYGGFSKEKAEMKMTVVPELSAFTINGSLMDRYEFINECANDIKGIFLRNSELRCYKFFLIANVEIINKNSRIENYKKVWKLLQNKWSLDKFDKGPEVELAIGDYSFYSSIAEFDMEDFSVALEIVASNFRKFTIIASKRENLLCESSVKDTFGVLFNASDVKFPMIDYFNLCINYCPKGDVVFRWGDSSEEITVGLIFNAELLEKI
ncbi:hypothetical protein C8E03_1296 [Lachnotalea glycerini]|uniref:Uncharacterized protein n=1 Tax=Lachnotalea glycerini TaxID=1763509 RepID=A0A318EG24_9FIRM|nr:hypothetical protein [Lachnotalea glycerini]PXV84495.1 hypothetical protein C8E03_1296 [Lachnotalea glycerini]